MMGKVKGLLGGAAIEWPTMTVRLIPMISLNRAQGNTVEFAGDWTEDGLDSQVYWA